MLHLIDLQGNIVYSHYNYETLKVTQDVIMHSFSAYFEILETEELNSMQLEQVNSYG